MAALVTGDGRRIGRATALELGATGARVVICGRGEEPLARTRGKMMMRRGGECLDPAADLREPEPVEGVVRAALERFGRIDVLVNNAAGNSRPPPRESRRTIGAPSTGSQLRPIAGTTIAVDCAADAWRLAEPPARPASDPQ